MPAAAQVVDQFQQNTGRVFPGFRRNHAEGVCVAGYLESTGAAAQYSVAQVFQRNLRTPVVGRLSIPGGNPDASDNSTPVRGMGLSFALADGQQWQMAMINAPVFQTATPQGFYEMLKLQQPDPASGKPDTAGLAAFFAAHPDTAPFQAWAKATKPSASFVTQRYNSLNAFEFVDAHEARHAVRWSMQPEATVGDDHAAPGDSHYLAADLRQRLARGPAKWKLMVTLADPNDPIDDSTRAWPADRRQIDAGTLMLQSSEPQATGACRDIDFDPLMLPTGIQGSSDPLLKFRAEVYANSFLRRTHEEGHAGS